MTEDEVLMEAEHLVAENIGNAKVRAFAREVLRLRNELAKAQAGAEAVRELVSAAVALEAAITSQPTMSGHLVGLHISTVRGAEPLRRFKVALSDPALVFP